MVCVIDSGQAVRGVFPPEEVAQVKAIACELPLQRGLPLSRFSRAELHRLVVERGVSEASASTIARWLREDALKPWQHRSWVFPTDPAFLERAGPVLDLYQGRWQGRLLHPGEFVICADEKPSIQARARVHPSLAPSPGSRGQRSSTPTSARVRSPTLPRSTSAAAGAGAARRVFWIVDNGSSHRGRKSVERLERRWPNLVLVHLPVHASWLNQLEIYFSIVQRKPLEPNDFDNLADLARTLNDFEHHWNEIAEPFDWNFTRDDLAALIDRLAAHEPQLQLAA